MTPGLLHASGCTIDALWSLHTGGAGGGCFNDCPCVGLHWPEPELLFLVVATDTTAGVVTYPCCFQALLGMHRVEGIALAGLGGMAGAGTGTSAVDGVTSEGTPPAPADPLLPPWMWDGNLHWANCDRRRWGDAAHPWEMMKVRV
jgi:hypothetical protein